MTLLIERLRRLEPSPKSQDPAGGEAMIGFSIAPTDTGDWLWRTFDQDGAPRAQGLAASKKQAAALVIRDIVQAQGPSAARRNPNPSAKAA